LSEYQYQAKATRRFGITFRSKLEAEWAYQFTEWGLDWTYADHAWYDFTIDGYLIEIKPLDRRFFYQALTRVADNSDQRFLFVICGSPNNDSIHDDYCIHFCEHDGGNRWFVFPCTYGWEKGKQVEHIAIEARNNTCVVIEDGIAVGFGNRNKINFGEPGVVTGTNGRDLTWWRACCFNERISSEEMRKFLSRMA